jgi:AcrR family transcriptional regulator
MSTPSWSVHGRSQPATHDGVATLRDEQVRQTRDALVAAGRALFGSDGFSATSVEAVAAAAGVTTGALYHHFRNKTELFAAVFEQVHMDVLVRNAQAAEKGSTEVGALTHAFDDFLDAVLEPDVQRIMVTDGPSVLGLQRFTELDERFAFAAVVETLQRAMANAELAVAEPEVLAHLLLGALVRGATLIAASPAPRRTRDAVSRTIVDLLAGLAP